MEWTDRRDCNIVGGNLKMKKSIMKSLILWAVRAAALVSVISLAMAWMGKDDQPHFMISVLMICVWAFSEFEAYSKKGRP